MADLASALAALSPEQIAAYQDMCLKASPGLWAEVCRGYRNAPFQDEWYDLVKTGRRSCIVAPRDHGKSECLTVNPTAWRSIYFPGWWTYIFANTAAQAAELKSRIDKAILETAPHLVDSARSLSRMESVYGNGARVTAASVGKAVRGAHPDTIIGDDVLEEETCLTEFQRKKMERWWFGTVGGMSHPGTTRVIPGYGKLRFAPTQVFLVGTPFHSQDLLMGMRTNRLYEFRRYAAEFNPDQLVPGTWAVEVTNRGGTDGQGQAERAERRERGPSPLERLESGALAW